MSNPLVKLELGSLNSYQGFGVVFFHPNSARIAQLLRLNLRGHSLSSLLDLQRIHLKLCRSIEHIWVITLPNLSTCSIQRAVISNNFMFRFHAIHQNVKVVIPYLFLYEQA